MFSIPLHSFLTNNGHPDHFQLSISMFEQHFDAFSTTLTPFQSSLHIPNPLPTLFQAFTPVFNVLSAPFTRFQALSYFPSFQRIPTRFRTLSRVYNHPQPLPSPTTRSGTSTTPPKPLALPHFLTRPQLGSTIFHVFRRILNHLCLFLIPTAPL